jgi:hypothetical protein
MSWLTRFGSWICSGCNKSSRLSTVSNRAQLPTPELSSLSRSMSRCSSLSLTKYAKCVTCKKALLGGLSGSVECKRCNANRKEDLAIQAKLAQAEPEKLQSERTQARRIAKPLFRKKPCTKIRTEKIHSLSTIDRNHMTSKPPVNSDGLLRSGKKSQPDLSYRKRKHGKTLRIVGTMDQTLICGQTQNHCQIQPQL